MKEEDLQMIVGIEQRYLEILKQEGIELEELGVKYDIEMIEQPTLEIADFRGSIYLLKDKEDNQKPDYKLEQKKELDQIEDIDKHKVNEKTEVDNSKQKVDEQIIKRQIELIEFIVDKIQDSNYKSIRMYLMVVEYMVSYVIGAKGHQINQLKDQSRAEIVFNEPYEKCRKYRAARIEGRGLQIVRAISLIRSVIEDKKHISAQNERKIVELQPVGLIYTQVRLLFDNRLVSHLIGKKGSFVQFLQEKFNIKVKFQQDRHNLHIKAEERICLMNGRLDQLQKAVYQILRRSKEFYNNIDLSYSEVYLKVVIDSRLTTKLIGSQGCIIKSIAKKSQGAQIQIYPIHQKDTVDNIVQVRASLENKFTALCLIWEKIESFKMSRQVRRSQENSRSRSRGKERQVRKFDDRSNRLDYEMKKYQKDRRSLYIKQRQSYSRSSRDSYSRDRKQSYSRDRRHSYSKDRKQSYSRDKKQDQYWKDRRQRSYSRDRKNSYSREKDRRNIDKNNKKIEYPLYVPHRMMSEIEQMVDGLDIEILEIQEKSQFGVLKMRGNIKSNTKLFRRMITNH